VKRRVFIVSAAVLLGLCVATVAIWIRSWSHMDQLLWRNTHVGICVVASSGDLGIVFENANSKPLTPFISYDRNDEPLKISGAMQQHHTVLGVSIGYGRVPELSYRAIIVPVWFLSLASAAACWRLIRSAARGGESGQALCRVCGYDLRATPNRCPECGTAVRRHAAGGGGLVGIPAAPLPARPASAPPFLRLVTSGESGN
jgi:hypothetical protein